MKFALTAALLLTSFAAHADTYFYQGNPFTKGSIDGSVSGSFTISGPLRDNLSEVLISPSSWSFTDGNSTLSNSTPLASETIEVWTNAEGQITNWLVQLDGIVDSKNPVEFVSLSTTGDRSIDNGISSTATTGTWEDSSTVPEPSSLILLGTGLFGVGGMIRRRLSA